MNIAVSRVSIKGRRLNFKSLVAMIRNSIFFISFFLIVLYLNFCFVAYSPIWYKLNCNCIAKCRDLGETKTNKFYNELTAYFLHKGTLEWQWSTKEKKHLDEVRKIFDFLFFIFCILLFFFVITFSFSKLKKYSRINIFLSLFFLLLIPVFDCFWSHIFHLLLFRNDYWINNILDVSYYILPISFFISSLTFISLSSAIINLLIYILTKRAKKSNC